MATTFNDATQGMNVEQRRAYRNSMTPPPATPVTPQPAPVPTVPPVTGQGAVVPPATPIATPSAPVATAPSQTMTPAPTTPPIIQANQPMVPTTPEAPQPAPVAPPKAPKTPKVQASTTPAIDYNQGLGREAEIMTHLKEFQAQGMNPDQIKLASGYATATPEKKAMIDGVIAGQNKPMDESSMYATIASGAVIPDAVKSTQAYQNAQNLYTKVSGYSTMSTSSLAHSMSTGDLLPGTQVYAELMKDPAMKQKITQAQAFTSTQPIRVEDVFQSASNDILSRNSTTANMLSDGTISQAEYDQETNTPAIISKASEVEAKLNKYNEIQMKYDDVDTQVEKDFPGNPFASQIIADRKKALYKDLMSAKGQYDTSMGTLTELKKLSSDRFETNLKLYSEQLQTQRQRESMVGQANLNLKADQMKFEQQMEQEAQSASDPVKGANRIIKMYADKGILANRSNEEIIADIQNQVAQGIPVGTALTNLNKAFQSKPEYQRLNQAPAPTIQNITNADGTTSQMTWNGSNWVPVNANQQMLNANISGVDVVKALASGNYNGSNFFGVYAKTDPQGTQRASIYNTINQQGLDAYMQRVNPNGPINADMVRQSASKFGIDPNILATFLQADSEFGTKGLGATNNNPGNVGQFDRYGKQAVKGYATMQEDIDAAAKNLASRQQGLQKIIGTRSGMTAGQITTQVQGVSSEFLAKPVGSNGGQCGFFANRSSGMSSEPGGDDSLSGRRKTYTDQSPVVGGTVFFDGKGYNQTNGHVALVTGINQDGTINIRESNLKGDGIITERTIDPSEAYGFYNKTPLARANAGGQVSGQYQETKAPQYADYNKTGNLPTGIKAGSKQATQFENEALAYKNSTSTGSSAESTDSYVNIVRQMSGGTKGTTDKEIEDIRRQAEGWKSKGLTPLQGYLAYSGMEIQDPKNTDIANQYLDVGDKLGKNRPSSYNITVAKYINNGDYNGLNQYVNKYVENEIKANTPADTYIPTSTLNSTNKNIDEIIRLIGNNKDKIGMVDGRLTDLKKKFGSEPEIQRLQSLMTATFAGYRKNFAGSAVTDTEMDALRNYITGDITETPENLVTKLQTLKEIQQREYDQQRSVYGIPSVQGIQLTQKRSALSYIIEKARSVYNQ